MRKILAPVVFCLATVAAFACGDKLMLVMRVGFAQPNQGRPVAILAYIQPDLPSSALVRQIYLQSAVKKAGHRIRFIDDTAKLDEALKADKYDLVLADVAVADELSQRARSSPFRPVVLPVAYKTTKLEDSAAQKRFHCLLKAPSDSEEYFEAIDQALQLKAKTAGR